MRSPRYNLQTIRESFNRIASAASEARAPEPGGARVTVDEVKALFSEARGPDNWMSVDEKVRIALEWGHLQELAEDEARAEFARLSQGLDLPDPQRLDAIRGALRLSWGPQVDSPAPQLSVKQLQSAVEAGRDANGTLDESSRFLLAYQWQSTPEPCKSPRVKQEYQRLATELGLPTFTE
jgi:hypothetical protein